MLRLLKCLTISALLMVTLTVSANNDHEHHGHSDDLLLLLQYKIQLKKLQAQFDPAGHTQALEKQRTILANTMKRLTRYVAVSRGNYPNDELFQQSLSNRSALLNDFTQLLSTYHQQLMRTSSIEPDTGQHANHRH